MSDFRNGANDLLTVMSDLRNEKSKIDVTIEHTKILFRLIELSEPYSTSVLKVNLKRDYFIDFCETILSDKLEPVLVEYPKFANALLNALLFHDVNSVWTKFFNIYDMTIFDVSKLESASQAMRANSRFVKNYEDYKIVDELLTYLVEGSKIVVEDFESISEFSESLVKVSESSNMIPVDSLIEKILEDEENKNDAKIV